MIIKADNDELENLSKRMQRDSDDFSIEIDKMISLINSLGPVWQGKDSDTFQKNATNYMEKMKAVPNSLTTLSSAVDLVNKGYIEKNEEFAKAIEEVKNRYAR